MFQHGRHNSGKLIAVRSIANEQELTRFAFAISKRVGIAVVRNRLRRRLREMLRLLPLREGFDIVISARPEAARSDFGTLRAELLLLLGRARLLEPPESPPEPSSP